MGKGRCSGSQPESLECITGPSYCYLLQGFLSQAEPCVEPLHRLSDMSARPRGERSVELTGPIRAWARTDRRPFMRVLILGGDGYLGWPTAMHFSARGHDVHTIDNYLRRRIHERNGTASLTPIAKSLPARATAWRQVTGGEIGVTEGDLLDWEVVESAFRGFRPEAIIHYGEMPSGPFSMKDRESAFLTQRNNVLGTLNLLWAIREYAPDAHLVKLGTMGEYGTPNIDIEEGWIEIQHKGRSDRMPYPKRPASLYHCTKVHDSVNIEFCCRAWDLRATDLNQGVVYGIETPESALDARLATRFDYDEVFGTALNRFCVEAVVGEPL